MSIHACPDTYQKLSALFSWRELKENFPEVASIVFAEHKAVNGFIPREPGFVYLIRAVGTNFYKIGKSINPDRRILQIAPKMPFDVRFVKVWRSDFMSLAETRLHSLNEEYRINGEWFELVDIEDNEEPLGNILSDYTALTVRYMYFDLLANKLNLSFSKTYSFGKPWSQVKEVLRRWTQGTCTDMVVDGEYVNAWIERLFFEIDMTEY